jgi:hypothetical protein
VLPAGNLDLGWAQQNGLKLVDGEHGDGKLVADKFADDVHIDIGDDHFVADTMLCLPLGCISEIAGVPVAGILGTNYLNDRVIRVDYIRGTVERQSPAGFTYGGPGVQVPLLLSRARVAATLVMISPSHAEPFGAVAILDTGCNYDFLVSAELATQAGLSAEPIDIQRRACNVQGWTQEVEHLALTRSISVGPATFSPPHVTIGSTPFAMPMLIGGGALYDYVVIIDYARCRIILEPNPEALPRRQSELGLLMDDRSGGEGATVRWLDPGLAGARAGVRVGDVLIKIEGESIKEMSSREWSERHAKAVRERRPFLFTVQREGRDIEVAIPAPEEPSSNHR